MRGGGGGGEDTKKNAINTPVEPYAYFSQIKSIETMKNMQKPFNKRKTHRPAMNNIPASKVVTTL